MILLAKRCQLAVPWHIELVEIGDPFVWYNFNKGHLNSLPEMEEREVSIESCMLQ